MQAQDIERLKELAVAATLSKEDKQYITDLSSEMGVAFTCSRCKNRYQDQVVLLYSRATSAELQSTENRYQLKAGVDVYFGHIRVNAATLTDELGDKLVAMGFDTKLFAKHEANA